MDFICQKNIFSNPYKQPLNELFLQIKVFKRIQKIPKDVNLDKFTQNQSKYYDIRSQKIPALDPYWIQEKRSYHEYQPYYTELTEDENIEFLTKNQSFIESLRYILNCSYHQFWCLLLFDCRVQKILGSFIENPMSCYETEHLSGPYYNVYSEVCDLFAKVVSRMLTFKQSEEEYMAESTGATYLEKTKIITYPRIMHLCLVYNRTNRELIDRVIRIFFKTESQYYKEVERIINHVLSVFEIIGGQICGFDDDSNKVIPTYVRRKPINFDPLWMEEVTSYLLDTGVNLNAFLSACKPAVKVSLKMGLPFRLTYFYNRVYHELYTVMNRRNSINYDWSHLKKAIYEHMAIARSEFVSIYHIFVADATDNIIQLVGDERQSEYVSQYLKLISMALEDEFFIFDYENTYPIDQQFQMIFDFCPDVDHTQTDYILECLATFPKLDDLERQTIEKEKYEKGKYEREKYEKENGKQAKIHSKENILPEVPSVKKKPSDSEIQNHIQSVLETLPHLGDGFILKCLEHYNYDTTQVLSAILDENLAQELLEIPPDLVRVPPEPKPVQPVLAYRGKKPQYRDAVDLLNDKTDIQLTKDFVLKTKSVCYDTYDDEYDDRDDIEAPSRRDEPDIYKYMENRFEGYELVSDVSESSEEEIEKTTKAGKKQQQKQSQQKQQSKQKQQGQSALKQATEEVQPEQSTATNNSRSNTKDFCEDPASVRERRDAHRRQFHNKNVDVVGKPKGQGQEASVQHNRDKKNANKSSKANHNRKSGAQWKRNKGMLPS